MEGVTQMPLISRQSIEELNRVVDIVDVVAGYVKLRPASGSLKGLCPFHHEKTPSFDVSPVKQLYHCFGCGAGGGVVDFIMRIENLDYVDALRFLADKYNVVLQEDQTANTGRQAEQHELRKRLLELNKRAARFFYDTFCADAGEAARAYAQKRGLDSKTIVKYGIGCAPDQWAALTDKLRADGFTDEELVQSGMVIKKDSGAMYDRFRNRLMFPIIDVRGNVIGFGGRALDDGVKYLNSPETPVFHKGYQLFGLNVAKNIGLKEGLVLVEGYMDAVSLHQRGITNVVAGLGTALTPDHAKLLKRYASEVYICYDSDEAGKKAAMRAIDILAAEGNKLRVVEVTGAKDPDEYIQQKGVESFRELMKTAKPAVGYKIAQLRKQYDLTDVGSQIEYVQAVAELLSALESAVERDAYMKRVAADSGIDENAVAVEVNKRIRDHVNSQRREERRQSLKPAGQLERMRTVASNPAYKAERMLLNLIFFEKKAYNIVTEQYGEELFHDPLHQNIYRKMIEFKKNSNDAQLFLGEWEPEERASVAEILYTNYVFEDSAEAAKAAEDCISRIRREQMGQNAQQDDLEKINELIKELKKGGA